MDINLRDRIIFGEDYIEKKYTDNIRQFANLSISQFKQLIDNNLVDLDQACNKTAPKVRDFYAFMMKYPNNCYIGGYVEALKKSNNPKFIIDEIHCTGKNAKAEFIFSFMTASILDISKNFKSALWTHEVDNR